MSLKLLLVVTIGALLSTSCGTDVIEHEQPDDSDRDGLDDATERELGTDPDDPDSDDDGLIDGAEVEQGRDPLDPSA